MYKRITMSSEIIKMYKEFQLRKQNKKLSFKQLLKKYIK